MTVNERIKSVINSSKKSVKNFAIEINIPKGTIDGVIGTRKSVPSFTLLNALLVHLPKLNPTWLMLGEGEMWLTDKKKPEESLKIKDSTQINLIKRVEELEKDYKEMKGLVLRIDKQLGVVTETITGAEDVIEEGLKE